MCIGFDSCASMLHRKAPVSLVVVTGVAGAGRGREDGAGVGALLLRIVFRYASSCFAVYQTSPHFGNQAAMVGFASGRRPYGFASSTFVDFAVSRSVGGSRVHQRARSRRPDRTSMIGRN
jgi:hypothetical protein